MFSVGGGFIIQEGNVMTVEPGFYKEGDFGVRTESVFIAKKIEVNDCLFESPEKYGAEYQDRRSTTLVDIATFPGNELHK